MTYLFIILHYHENTLNFTFDCIESIINLENKNNKVHIMVVDNGSNDSSTIKLKEIEHRNVEIISLKKNLGFSNSINYAATLGVEKYNPDLIVSANNDTKIISKDFFSTLNDTYSKKPFDLLGPKIIDRKNKNQNPYYSFVNSKNNNSKKLIKKMIKTKMSFEKIKNLNTNVLFKVKFNLKIYFINFFNSNRVIKFFYKIIKNRGRSYNLNPDRYHFNVALHGAFIIFSRNFFDKFKFLFYPKKNFFVEEDLLFLIIKNEYLQSIYNPKILVHHYEDASTNASKTTMFDKELWILDETINSLKVFNKLMETYTISTFK